ncbi:MAG: ectonucleotide pyrophosphatase/phosphodiesterase [Burkholderiaceae bacterium]
MTRSWSVLIPIIACFIAGLTPSNAFAFTLLIGIDGFRGDYLSRGFSPTLEELAKQGAVSFELSPVYPSVTFPNHVSIVTGQYPGKHGIVNNFMKDPNLPGQTFRLADRNAVTAPQWWAEATPLWVTLAQQGKLSYTMFWPGAEASIQGVRPAKWLAYNHSMTSMQRVEQLLSWLSESSTPPTFATLYFSEVDSQGHAAGPNHGSVNDAIQSVDTALAFLFSELKSRGLWESMSVVVAADHGMAHVRADQVVYGPKLLEGMSGVSWEWSGPAPGVRVNDPSLIPDVLKRLGAEPSLSCWPKGKTPKALGPTSHRRFPDVLCLSKEGWSTTDRRIGFPIPGQHGFDPSLLSMQGLLIAYGPKVKPGKLSRVRNIDVYPLLCALTQAQCPRVDASPDLATRILRDQDFRK